MYMYNQCYIYMQFFVVPVTELSDDEDSDSEMEVDSLQVCGVKISGNLFY